MKYLVILFLLISTNISAQEPPKETRPPLFGWPVISTEPHPDTKKFNETNPYAKHYGPGKPNIGKKYEPPSLYGKKKE